MAATQLVSIGLVLPVGKIDTKALVAEQDDNKLVSLLLFSFTWLYKLYLNYKQLREIILL